MRFIVCILLFLFALRVNAQVFNMGNLGIVTNACGGTFYDSGGLAGQYGNSQDFTATFCAPAGQFISFDFTSFTTANSQDFWIYMTGLISTRL